MLKLYPALNQIDVWTVRPQLQLLERPAPVHRLHVLVLLQEPQNLTTADAGGGPVWAPLRGGARPARETLSSPGAFTGAQNQGGARAEGGGEEGILYGRGRGQRGGRRGGRVGRLYRGEFGQRQRRQRRTNLRII